MSMRIDHKPNQFVIRIKNKPVFPLPLIKKGVINLITSLVFYRNNNNSNNNKIESI